MFLQRSPAVHTGCWSSWFDSSFLPSSPTATGMPCSGLVASHTCTYNNKNTNSSSSYWQNCASWETCFSMLHWLTWGNTAGRKQIILNGYITLLYFYHGHRPAVGFRLHHNSTSTAIVLWALLLCLFPHPFCNVSHLSSPGNSPISIWRHACISRAPCHTGSSGELLSRDHYLQRRQHHAHCHIHGWMAYATQQPFYM